MYTQRVGTENSLGVERVERNDRDESVRIDGTNLPTPKESLCSLSSEIEVMVHKYVVLSVPLHTSETWNEKK